VLCVVGLRVFVCVCTLEYCGMNLCSFGHVHCGVSKQQLGSACVCQLRVRDEERRMLVNVCNIYQYMCKKIREGYIAIYASGGI
jgi:hypothetical protein